MSRQYFGTDGIRGTVGQSPMVPDFVLRLGQAAGTVLGKYETDGRRPRVLIGKDTRVSGYLLESCLEAGFTSVGVDVVMVGPMPTAGVAYLARALNMSAGVVISASHNPYQDNGIKFFSGEGTKLPDAWEMEIEAQLALDAPCKSSEELGKAKRLNDAAGRYIEFCKGTFPRDKHLRGLKIVVDCANGAAYQIAPAVFRELGADVVVLADQPDGLNINRGVGATYPDFVAKSVLEHRADYGFALDGDADRLICVDGTGRVYNGDELLFALVAERLHMQGKVDGVVGTLMTNLGLELTLGKLGVPFERAKVGDRYVMAELLEREWLVGGENSGHVVCCNHTTTGDAIIAALQVLMALKRREQTLGEARLGMQKCPQVLVNVRFAGGVDPLEHPAVQQASARVTEQMAGRGRVLLRKSGTEPLVRVMVEGDDEGQVRGYADELAKVVADVCA